MDITKILQFIKKYWIILVIIICVFLFKDCSQISDVFNWVKGCAPEITQTTDSTYIKQVEKYKQDSTYYEKTIRELRIQLETKVPQSDLGRVRGDVGKDTSKGIYLNTWYVYNQLISRPDGGWYRIDSAIIDNKKMYVDVRLSASPVKRDTVIKDSVVYIYKEKKDSSSSIENTNVKKETTIKLKHWFATNIHLDTKIIDENSTGVNPLDELRLTVEPELKIADETYVNMKFQTSLNKNLDFAYWIWAGIKIGLFKAY